ncbi:unnamed protein product, partial [Symbiodinium microadriaticum]
MTGEAAAPPQEVDGTGGDGGPTLGLHLMADGEVTSGTEMIELHGEAGMSLRLSPWKQAGRGLQCSRPQLLKSFLQQMCQTMLTNQAKPGARESPARRQGKIMFLSPMREYECPVRLFESATGIDASYSAQKLMERLLWDHLYQELEPLEHLRVFSTLTEFYRGFKRTEGDRSEDRDGLNKAYWFLEKASLSEALMAIVPKVKRDEVSEMLKWRVNSGHRQFFPDSGETLSQRLCSRKLWNFQQEVYNEVYDYLSKPVPGVVLSFLAVALWMLTI